MSVVIEVDDATQSPVDTFTADIVVGDLSLTADCSGETVIRSPDGEGLGYCQPGLGLVLWYVASDEPTLSLAIRSSQGGYQGSVHPIYRTEENFNGFGCGSCTSGHVTVVLD